MKNKLIVFDIDDTLYDEIDYVKSGYRAVADYVEKKYGVQDIYDRLMTLFAKSPKNVFNRLLDELSNRYDDSEVIDLVNTYRRHKPDIKLSHEISDTLNILKNKYYLAVVSDGNYETQKLKCESLGLDEFFNAIVLTDRYGKDYWKPSRKPFDILSNKFGIKLNDMYYVGDNPAKDFYLSIYGINTVRFYNPNGVHFAEKYKDNIVEKYRIDKISGIIELLD